ncbi:T9SS type A sorting domain-containing protein [Seonamhaeicola sp. NFXS20]|uniref:T9SS type A sorting domain-containing protein n=1 Tax=unclassified Seonamhaeicola TaxID=2622645 RepID=UPI00356160D4
MKTKLQLIIMIGLFYLSAKAQETAVNISMGANYANDVYFKLSDESTNTYTRSDWDIAFLRTSAYSFSLRVNDGAGIQVFDVSNDPAYWNSVDVLNEGNWTELQNDETSWDTGAFDTGSADGAYPYGWGNYIFATHHIEGDVVFVLKYSDGTYIKFFCEEYYNGYTFKYSSWDGSTWSADTTVTIPNTDNVNNKFNYYSLKNNQSVVAEPGIGNWDLKFSRYTTDYYGDGSLFYMVTGVLHSDEVTVAQNEELSGMPVNPSLTYSDEINTIGYDWKSFNGSGYDVDQTQAFYVKYADDTVYRLYFTTFEGSSTGNIGFSFENVTSSLGISNVGDSLSFGVYPNPSSNKQINLIYDVSDFNSNKNKISVYSTTGKKVFESELNSNSGFYNRSFDLSSLSSGIYVLQLTSGNKSVSKKLILN